MDISLSFHFLENSLEIFECLTNYTNLVLNRKKFFLYIFITNTFFTFICVLWFGNDLSAVVGATLHILLLAKYILAT